LAEDRSPAACHEVFRRAGFRGVSRERPQFARRSGKPEITPAKKRLHCPVLTRAQRRPMCEDLL